MMPMSGRWTLALALGALGLLVLAAIAGSAVAAPLGSASGGLSDLGFDRAPVFEAVLLGAVGLIAIALVEQAERWR